MGENQESLKYIYAKKKKKMENTFTQRSHSNNMFPMYFIIRKIILKHQIHLCAELFEQHNASSYSLKTTDFYISFAATVTALGALPIIKIKY